VTKVVELLVPCRPVVVEVRLGSDEVLTPLERAFVEAIQVGEHNFGTLTRVLGVNRRVALDLIFDLWQSGMVVVDITSSVVDLSEATKRDLAAKGIIGLAGVAGRAETRELMQDQVTGQLLSTRHHSPSRPTNGRVVPAKAPPRLEEISSRALRAPLADDIKHDRRLRGHARVMEARLASHTTPREGHSYWLRIRVERSVLPTGDIDVTVLHHDALTQMTRVEMAQQILAAIEEAPDAEFAAFLREGADEGIEVPDIDPVRELDQLLRWTNDLDGLEAGRGATRHLQLETSGSLLERWLVSGEAGDHVAIALVGGPPNEAAVEELMASPRKQLVVVSPTPDNKRWRLHLPRVEAALETGCQVFLLWGTERGSVLASDIAPAIAQLQQRYPRHFFFSSDRSVSMRTDMVISDDRAALITSAGAFTPRHGGAVELGVQVSATAEETPCLPVEQLLRWCRDAYPESAIASAMLVLAEDFRAAAEVERASIKLPLQPAPPPGAHAHLAGPEMHVWRRGWEGYAAAISALVAERGMTGIRLVQGAEHRLVLHRALRTAERRLLVAGRELGADVVDEGFVALLRSRLLRHVEVGLVIEGFAAAGGPGPILADLRSEFDELRLVDGKPTRAHVLVADDMALISSFEFLSNHNYFEQAQGGRRRRSSHVGVLVRDPVFVDELLRLLGEAFPGQLDGFGTSRPRPSAIRVASAGADPTAEVVAANHLLSQLEAAAPNDDRASLVTASLREAEDPAALASLLFEAALPPELLEAAAATVLLGEDGESAVRAHLRGFLVKRAWERDDFVAAAVLAGRGDPPLEIALLAAAIGTPEFPRAAERALEAGTAPGASALLGTLAAAVGGHDEGAVLAEAGRAELDAGAAAIIGALLEFAANAPAPLPLHALELRTERMSADENLEDLWQRLDEALEASRSRDLYPQWMNEVVIALHDEHGFGALETAVARRDHEAVAAWVEAHGLDADRLLDDASVRSRCEHIFGKRRNAFQKYTREVVRSVKMLARTPVTDPGTTDDRVMDDAVMRCVEALQEGWDGLRSARESASPGLRPVFDLVIRRLLPAFEVTLR
jgi:hypothetical protein